MKRILVLGLFLCGMNLIAFSQGGDYYLKQAESYQREAKYYFDRLNAMNEMLNIIVIMHRNI